MCRVLGVHFSGFYAWLKAGLKPQARRRRNLAGLIKQSWIESGGVYGSRKVHHDLLGLGENCAENTVARLMRAEGLRAQVGYKRRPGKHGGKPSVVATNQLDQAFDVAEPDQIWVTDITYIRTYEGWLYLAVVIDLYARKVVGPPGLAPLKSILDRFVRVTPEHYTRGDALSHAHIARSKCLADGRLAAQAEEQGRGPFRSGIAIYQSGMAGLPEGSQSGRQHEPPW